MPFYDAFISYSHAKDKPIAAALQSVIQRLGKPWYRRRALRLFRDDTSLSATPHLWPTIEQALGQSAHFILLASPEAAASKWVDREVSRWLESNPIDRFFIGLTDGDLAWDEAAGDFSTAATLPLPSALARRFASEPKWVDLRAYREGADKRDAKFTELAADFAAAIRNIPKEDLLSQEVRQQRRALTLAWLAASVLLVLAITATSATWLAYRAQQRAEQALAQARQKYILALSGATNMVEHLLRTPSDLFTEPGHLIFNQANLLLAGTSGRASIAIKRGATRSVLGPDDAATSDKTLKIGRHQTIEFSSDVRGNAVLVDISPAGTIAPLFPRGIDRPLVEKSEPHFIELVAQLPLGKGVLLLIVVPAQFDIGPIPADDPKVSERLLSIFGRISAILRDQQATAESSLPDWAFAVMEYEIVE